MPTGRVAGHHAVRYVNCTVNGHPLPIRGQERHPLWCMHRVWSTCPGDDLVNHCRGRSRSGPLAHLRKARGLRAPAAPRLAAPRLPVLRSTGQPIPRGFAAASLPWARIGAVCGGLCVWSLAIGRAVPLLSAVLPTCSQQ